MAAAASASDDGQTVTVRFSPSGGEDFSARFHSVWLRDHCRCPQCLHPLTQQRLVDTATIPLDITPSAVAPADAGRTVMVRWYEQGGRTHESPFPADWLAAHAYWPVGRSGKGAAEIHAAREVDPALDKRGRHVWEAARFGERGAPDAVRGFPAVPFAEYMAEGDAGVLKALRLLRDFGFVRVEGCPATEADTEAVCRRVAFLRETLYGAGMWRTEVRADPSKVNDTAYTGLPLAPHTDGNYWQDTPGIQVFHCIQADPDGGGDSVLVDGFALAAAVKAASPEAFTLLSSLPLPYHHTDPDATVHAQKRVFVLDGDGDVCAVQVNNDDRAPFVPPQLTGDVLAARALLGHALPAETPAAPPSPFSRPDIVPAFYRAWRVLQGAMRDPALQLWFGLRPGAVLLFDNTRVLHGRAGFSGRSPRVLMGCYIGKEDWHSRLRTLERRLAGSPTAAAPAGGGGGR